MRLTVQDRWDLAQEVTCYYELNTHKALNPIAVYTAITERKTYEKRLSDCITAIYMFEDTQDWVDITTEDADNWEGCEDDYDELLNSLTADYDVMERTAQEAIDYIIIIGTLINKKGVDNLIQAVYNDIYTHKKKGEIAE